MPTGELGPVYGVQWRSWPTPDGEHIDQIAEVIEAIKTNPDSRRTHRVGLERRPTSPTWRWRPCHALFQFYVADGKLSCQLYQRSADLFLGVPFNIASYALLTHMVAAAGRPRGRRLRLDRRRLPHLRQPRRAGDRAAQPRAVPGPAAAASRTERDSIFDYEYDDLEVVEDYQHHPAIRGAVAV